MVFLLCLSDSNGEWDAAEDESCSIYSSQTISCTKHCYSLQTESIHMHTLQFRQRGWAVPEVMTRRLVAQAPDGFKVFHVMHFNVQKDQNRAFLCVSCLIMSCRFNLVPRDSWMNWKHQHVYAFIQWIPIYISTYINAGVVSWHQQVTGVQLVFMDCGRFAHSEARGHHHVLSIQQDKQ